MINNRFVIYGERNSGTNYLEVVLSGQSHFLSYPNSAFNADVINASVSRKYLNFYGNKHFFGWFDENIKQAKNIIFIGIARNPYDWIAALYRKKHHIPPENHEIKNFLTNEWYSVQHDPDDPSYGQELMDDRNFHTGILRVKPGLRYKNIFEMRSTKLKYLFETMPLLSTNYEFIKYEDFISNTMNILTQWAKKYNLELNQSFMPAIKKEPYKIPEDIKDIIDDGIDWEIENKVGYYIR